MSDRKKVKTKLLLIGTEVVFLNGLFGSGGGIVAVPLLRSCGTDQKSAHACSLAVTLPLSALSAILYLGTRELPWQDALRLIPAGIPGALLGGGLFSDDIYRSFFLGNAGCNGCWRRNAANNVADHFRWIFANRSTGDKSAMLFAHRRNCSYYPHQKQTDRMEKAFSRSSFGFGSGGSWLCGSKIFWFGNAVKAVWRVYSDCGGEGAFWQGKVDVLICYQ